MTYIKVMWKHNNKDYPIILYSELDEISYETRKVEEFYDGVLTYADKSNSSGKTRLGEIPVPSLEAIGSDPQFESFEISQEEFESVWKEAITRS